MTVVCAWRFGIKSPLRRFQASSTLDSRQMMNIAEIRTRLHAIPNPSLGLYLHIPFCRVRCQFCAFYVQPQQEEKIHAFLEGLTTELQLYSQELGLGTIPVTTVYFGGGTPTALSVNQLAKILETIQQEFAVSSDAEISVEAHPGTVDLKSLETLRSKGFNRLSIGAQSFDDQELTQLGGRSMSEATNMAMNSARRAGFENLSLDLMYGFPGQTRESWQGTLDATVALKSNHLSCYAFTVEEGSHFHQKVQQGRAGSVDEEEQARLATITTQFLHQAGYNQYEISNFCQPGFACQHNLRYWQGESYLGMGPSAQSFVSGVRFGNIGDLDVYCRTLKQGTVPVDQWEILDCRQIQRERIVFGLRTIQGVNLQQIQSLEKSDPGWALAYQGMKAQELLTESEGIVRLTTKGTLFADTVAVALL